MKKITISYISVGLVILFVALILVIHFKNKKLNEYQNKRIVELESRFYTAVDLIEKQEQKLTDTISYYKSVLKRDEATLKEKNAYIKAIQARISTISGQVGSNTSDENYALLQTKLETKADSLRFSFSANQIRQLAGDELELEQLRPLCSEYEQVIDLLSSQANYQDEIIISMAEKEDLLNKKFGECEKLTKDLNKELKKSQKKQKNTAFWNKALTVATGVAIITALLK